MKFCIYFRNRLASVLSIPILNMGFWTLTPIWLCTTSILFICELHGRNRENPPRCHLQSPFCNAQEGLVSHSFNFKTVIYRNAGINAITNITIACCNADGCISNVTNDSSCMLPAACLFSIFFAACRNAFTVLAFLHFLKICSSKSPLPAAWQLLAIFGSDWIPKQTPSGGCEMGLNRNKIPLLWQASKHAEAVRQQAEQNASQARRSQQARGTWNIRFWCETQKIGNANNKCKYGISIEWNTGRELVSSQITTTFHLFRVFVL